MKAKFEKITPTADRSFHVSVQEMEQFDAPWHFHPEVELTWIVQSRGRRFVGDSIAPFREGDLVLLGPDLPHFWLNEGHQPTGSLARSVVVQFETGFLGNEIWDRPEFLNIRRLLDRSTRGLKFSASTSCKVINRLKDLPDLSGMRALVQLLDLLELLADDRKACLLASLSYAPVLDRYNEERLARVYRYAVHHFRDRITLSQLAKEAAMSPAAFSRSFKRSTGRAPSDFLNDLRIENACRLLRESQRTMVDIAHASGYTTVTNFNRRFKERMGTTPRTYRKMFF